MSPRGDVVGARADKEGSDCIGNWWDRYLHCLCGFRYWHWQVTCLGTYLGMYLARGSVASAVGGAARCKSRCNDCQAPSLPD